MLARLLTALVLAVLVVVGPSALAASAHIDVSSSSTAPGTGAALTFRVPTEKDVATTKFEVALPTDAPIADVHVEGGPGWAVALTRAAPASPLKDESGNAVTEVVSRVTWTASGDGIKPDEFAAFQILVDPLPKSNQLVFKALQTYADGSVVSWIELPAAAGAPEPQFPAPVLALSAAETSTVAPAASAGAVTSAAETSAPATSGLAVVAAFLAALALVVSALALLRSRRTA